MSPSIKGRVSYEQDLKVELKPLVLDDLLHSSNEKLFDELVSRFALNLQFQEFKLKGFVSNRKQSLLLKLGRLYCKVLGWRYILNLHLMNTLYESCSKRQIFVFQSFIYHKIENFFIMKRFDIKRTILI